MVRSSNAMAPVFTLPDSAGKLVSLSDYRGKNVLLAFYPGDFTPICTNQLREYSEANNLFARHNTVVLAVSIDTPQSHAAFKEKHKLDLTLLSDYDPKGAVGKQYGAYDEHQTAEQRALFLIDGEGIIQWSYLSPLDKNPGVDRIIEALQSFDADGRTAAHA
jgi:peroxiredoxin